MTRIRVVFLGHVQFSEAMLEVVTTHPAVRLEGIVTRQAAPENADFKNLASWGTRMNVPVLFAGEGGMADFLARLAPDIVLCMGWSRLLRSEILTIPRYGVIGYHPAALPANRGRHPVIWALALGLPETASSFFQMDVGADTGDIIDQCPVHITPEDTAATLYARLRDTARQQLTGILDRLARDGTLTTRAQDPAMGNSWRKRGRRDGEIDWRMSADAIVYLVRALSHPYVGAHCRWQDQDVKIWFAEMGPPAPANLEPGKVLAHEGSDIIIKCWGGTVRLTEHAFAPLPPIGAYL